jgi:tellurite resistance protein TehA-like permease
MVWVLSVQFLEQAILPQFEVYFVLFSELLAGYFYVLSETNDMKNG